LSLWGSGNGETGSCNGVVAVALVLCALMDQFWFEWLWVGEILSGDQLLVNVIEGVLDQHHELFKVVKCLDHGLKCLAYPMGVQLK